MARPRIQPPVNNPEALQGVARALRLLSCFRMDQPELGVTDLSEALGLGKSNVHRILTTLMAYGFVRQTADGRYCLGVKTWEIGWVAIHASGLRQQALPLMQRLVAEVGETALLAVYDKGEVVYLEKVDGAAPIRAYSEVGGRAPAHCVATGKALLAFQPSAEIERLLAQGLPRFTARSEVEPAAVRANLARVRDQGYAMNQGEWRLEVGGVAAPVWDHTGTVRAAVGISGPCSRLGAERLAAIIPAVRARAAELSRLQGYLGLA